jgi:class 3 adenylate cyclase
MFADIRDFTPTTEICRNFNLIDELTEFVKKYTAEMSLCIQAEGGRVHALAGDGIMALFGEYDLDPRQAAARAIQAAQEMCEKFEVLKKDFFLNAKVLKFFHEENEPLDMRLGIGISFGSVIFDYFGLPGSRTYGPLGDHVNFAQRLESEANRFDPQLVNRLNRPKDCPPGMRAPILVSRPAWVAAQRSTQDPPLAVSVKGKPYAYQCYECWPEQPGATQHHVIMG